MSSFWCLMLQRKWVDYMSVPLFSVEPGSAKQEATTQDVTSSHNTEAKQRWLHMSKYMFNKDFKGGIREIHLQFHDMYICCLRQLDWFLWLLKNKLEGEFSPPANNVFIHCFRATPLTRQKSFWKRSLLLTRHRSLTHWVDTPSKPKSS